MGVLAQAVNINFYNHMATMSKSTRDTIRNNANESGLEILKFQEKMNREWFDLARNISDRFYEGAKEAHEDFFSRIEEDDSKSSKSSKESKKSKE